ncbi:spore germination protein GerPE [Paenibacillus sp. N3.4]|uniref:spore germination protein GerPE n=1 Tax=Paenibacillus sp. N3.4 TaxID=2603222 RepID=UPI0011CA33ED|nr:spore germination protein GerPE [Paenibacillus sp. N3.4]TXK74828.1 spore germination protein GerPE [Paenibacillus sp. N3.4]
MGRLSIVGAVYINDVSSSSFVHVGDHATTILQSRAFAVQREVPFFYGNEGSFSYYPFYQRPFPIPQPHEPFTMCVDNLGSFIRVGGIRILGISSSSGLQIGCNRITAAETRIKDIRQFVTDKPGPKQQATFVKVGQNKGVGDFEAAIKTPPR